MSSTVAPTKPRVLTTLEKESCFHGAFNAKNIQVAYVAEKPEEDNLFVSNDDNNERNNELTFTARLEELCGEPVVNQVGKFYTVIAPLFV